MDGKKGTIWIEFVFFFLPKIVMLIVNELKTERSSVCCVCKGSVSINAAPPRKKEWKCMAVWWFATAVEWSREWIARMNVARKFICKNCAFLINTNAEPIIKREANEWVCDSHWWAWCSMRIEYQPCFLHWLQFNVNHFDLADIVFNFKFSGN